MKIDEVIKVLEKYKEKFGNLEVCHKLPPQNEYDLGTYVPIKSPYMGKGINDDNWCIVV